MSKDLAKHEKSKDIKIIVGEKDNKVCGSDQYIDGYNKGYSEGFVIGFNEDCGEKDKDGYEDGYNKGFEIGYIKGLNESRVEGYEKCLSDVNIFLEELKEGIIRGGYKKSE